MVGAASFSNVRAAARARRPPGGPAQPQGSSNRDCSGSGSVEDGATWASLQLPLPHTTTAKAEGGGGEGGRGARPRCPHRCPCSVLPCVMVPSTAACPSDCRGSKQVASDSVEGYTTCTSLPLLWGWPLSRQQASCSAGVGRGAPMPLTPQRPSMPAQQH